MTNHSASVVVRGVVRVIIEQFLTNPRCKQPTQSDITNIFKGYFAQSNPTFLTTYDN